MKRERSQLRKYLFYGLTLVLASAFVFLAIQGRRLEKEQMLQNTENIQDFDSTPIRVLAPQDIEILSKSMILETGNTSGELPVARHSIEIYNAGSVSYCEIQLRLDYVDAQGTVLASIPYGIKEPIPSGDTLVSNDFLVQNIPVATTEWRPAIVYGDFEPVESEQAR